MPAPEDVPEPTALQLMQFVQTGQLSQAQAIKARDDLDLDTIFTNGEMDAGMSVQEAIVLIDDNVTGSRQEWTHTYRDLVNRRSKSSWSRREIVTRLLWVSTRSE